MKCHQNQTICQSQQNIFTFMLISFVEIGLCFGITEVIITIKWSTKASYLFKILMSGYNAMDIKKTKEQTFCKISF